MATPQYVRSFNRFEYKYVVSHDEAAAFRESLGPYTIQDPHSDPERGYPVYSIYWDSPELTFFWEKLDGVKYRRKLRFRRYAGGDGAFVEIKQRIDRTVQKRRVLLDVPTIQRRFRWGADEADEGAPGEAGDLDAAARPDPVELEAHFLCRHFRLEPRVAVSYRRQALFGRYEQDLRITFDSRLRYSAHDLALDEPFEIGKQILPADRVVLEIKFNERVPLWLCKLIQHHGLEMVRMSKYCSAVDRELFQARFT